MKKFLIPSITLFLLFLSVNVFSSKEFDLSIEGLYKIEVRTGSIILFKGIKKCYWVTDEEKKQFEFGSIHEDGYHLKVTLIKE